MIDSESQYGLLLDGESSFTLGELSRCCGVHAEFIIEMVEEGILNPLDRDPGCWRFPGPSLLLVNSALRLQRDLGVNLAGIALAFELMDEIRRLRLRLQRLDTGD
ncbi:MAG: MerR family transcriptional regulator [Gammaproteobacteria bacterium]|nr:MerR family transcriptional regulator [Gammaproteobacteria bacterium]MCB1902760.1 MerR family transcriptional regulator [Gammaproteobacteria bacterium]